MKEIINGKQAAMKGRIEAVEENFEELNEKISNVANGKSMHIEERVQIFTKDMNIIEERVENITKAVEKQMEHIK